MNSEEGYVSKCTNTTWSVYSKIVLNHRLSFICINVRSLLGKFDQFVGYLSSMKGSLCYPSAYNSVAETASLSIMGAPRVRR